MSSEDHKAQEEKNTAMAVLAYIGPLVILSYLSAKDDSFVKFHIKQGLVLLVIEVAMWFFGMLLWALWMVLWVVNLAVIVLVVIGVLNAIHGKEQKLPFVGEYAKYFTF